MPYLDTLGGLQCVSAAGAVLSRLGQGDISNDVCLEIAGVIGALEMGVRLIRSSNEVVSVVDGRVHNLLDAFQTDGRRRTGY